MFASVDGRSTQTSTQICIVLHNNSLDCHVTFAHVLGARLDTTP